MTNSICKIPKPYNEPVLMYSKGSPEKLRLKKELSLQESQTVDIPLIINGERITSQEKKPLTSPHNKKLTIAQLSQATSSDIEHAIKSSIEARKEWAALPWADRAAVFLKAADLICGKYRTQMVAATMLGQSKTCYQSEIEAACELADFLRFNAYFAERIYEDQPMHSPVGNWNQSSARPLEGFVFAIAPFNFTAISLNLACAPALMGCGVLWKPSPTAALSSYYGMKILEEAGLPPGVINMVQGDPETIGNLALNHKDLAGVHFTGSTKTFRHIWKKVGNQIEQYRSYPRIVGETGGKDFVFAHESADPEQLCTALIRGAFEYQGQKCSAASRAYIPRKLWGQIRGKLIEETQAIKMGDPNNFQNFMAAVIDDHAFNKIKSYIEHARAANDAEIICGGEYDQSVGNFIRPTIIETTNPQYKSMVEEIFGPVLTVYAYDEDLFEETLDLCDHSSEYALTGAIFAKDRRTIHYMSQKLENAAGNFYINDKPTGAIVGQQPFGGARGSGTNDKAGSMYNLLRWVSHRTIKENFLPVVDYRYPHMEEV